MEKIAPFIAGGGSERVLWKSKLHSTWDNHFSGCQILNCYATTMTCRRNRLPKNAVALAVAVAYDIYKECLTETAAQEFWQLTDLEKKRNKPLFFFDFRDKLSQQACWYSPVNQYYPGDKNFRVVTAMSKEHRDQAKRKKEHITTKAKRNCFILEEQYNEIKKKMKLDNTRFCGDLTKIKKHLAAKESIMHKLHFAVCGKSAYSRCTICNVGLHVEGTRSKDGNRSCYMDFHCNTYFSLCKINSPTAKGNASWTPLTPKVVAENRLALKRLEAGCMPTRRRSRSSPRKPFVQDGSNQPNPL
ncbi:hypothetical protein IV203_012113 [Nitzschia inconspicua]|uniref:Uncharacterized protein n=1 Tax=Nitzschia inconspicua TaxID=303405 RepID=A0A9K3KU10_9STRA|nr:hypothetical protein IV203_012113 [Nitzschia inconspicua]